MVVSWYSKGSMQEIEVSLATSSLLMSVCERKILSRASLIPLLGCVKAQREVCSEHCGGSAFMLELDSSWKAVVVKARSGVSVVRKTNNDSGRGGGSEGTRSGFSKRSEKKGVGTNGGGGVSIGCEGGVDAKVQ